MNMRILEIKPDVTALVNKMIVIICCIVAFIAILCNRSVKIFRVFYWSAGVERLRTAALDNFMHIKVEALGHRRTVKQVVSSGNSRQFHNFRSWLRVDCRMIGNLIGLHFWKHLRSAVGSTQLRRSAWLQPVSIVVSPVPQRAVQSWYMQNQ